MNLNQVIKRLKEGSNDVTLYDGAAQSKIEEFEMQMGFKLPADLRAFYQICDGFEVEEDLFRIIPLKEIVADSDHFSGRLKINQFYLAEYLVYCDMWKIEVSRENPDSYTIFGDTAKPEEIVLTHSFSEFLSHFLIGRIFGANGLYDWAEEVAREL